MSSANMNNTTTTRSPSSASQAAVVVVKKRLHPNQAQALLRLVLSFPSRATSQHLHHHHQNSTQQDFEDLNEIQWNALQRLLSSFSSDTVAATGDATTTNNDTGMGGVEDKNVEGDNKNNNGMMQQVIDAENSTEANMTSKSIKLSLQPVTGPFKKYRKNNKSEYVELCHFIGSKTKNGSKFVFPSYLNNTGEETRNEINMMLRIACAFSGIPLVCVGYEKKRLRLRFMCRRGKIYKRDPRLDTRINKTGTKREGIIKKRPIQKSDKCRFQFEVKFDIATNQWIIPSGYGCLEHCGHDRRQQQQKLKNNNPLQIISSVSKKLNDEEKEFILSVYKSSFGGDGTSSTTGTTNNAIPNL